MSIKRVEIETGDINLNSGRGFAVPVYYTSELVESSVYHLAFSTETGKYLPCLLAGYFTDGRNIHQWFFSNASRPEEMRKAVEQEIRRGVNYYTYGWMSFNPSALREGKLRFDSLILDRDLPDKKKALDLLKMVIQPDYLEVNFEIG